MIAYWKVDQTWSHSWISFNYPERIFYPNLLLNIDLFICIINHGKAYLKKLDFIKIDILIVDSFQKKEKERKTSGPTKI